MTAPVISLVNALGWTLIHSVWQALVIFAILRLLLALLRRAPAYIRYNLSCWALGSIFVWFLITFYHQWQSLAVQALSVSSVMPAMADLYVPAHVSANATGGFFAIASLLPWVVGLYVAGLLVFIAKVMRDVLALFYIRSSRVQPFDPAWEKYLLKLSGAWHLRQRIRLYLSERIDVPVVIGQLKPIIYLPFSMVTNLTPGQIEAILLHELAHIKRYDFLLNILQTVVETILFFNPFVWWISRSIRRERENCCDDMVLSLTQRKLYAGALLALEENRFYKGRFVLAATGREQQLFHRIKRIMEAKTKKMNAVQRLLVLLVLAGSIFSIAWLAPEKKPADQPAAAPVPVLSMARAAAGQMPTDTTFPVPAPPATPVTPTHPAPPAPPAAFPAAPPPLPAGMPLPPAPDSQPGGDTAAHGTGSFSWAPLSDSALKNMQNRIGQYYNSPEWKKYQKELQEYSSKIKQYYNGPEWKKYQKDIQQYSSKIAQYYNSPEGKKYLQDIQAYGKKMGQYFNSAGWKDKQKAIQEKIKEQFNSDAWRQHMDSIRVTVAADRLKMDSTMSQKWSQVALSKLNGYLSGIQNSTMVYSGSHHTVDPAQIVGMLRQDGLVDNKKNYKIRINNKGLYVNGKKQDPQYFDKYRRIIGDHTDLEIKKKGDHIQTSIITNKETNKKTNKTSDKTVL